MLLLLFGYKDQTPEIIVIEPLMLRIFNQNPVLPDPKINTITPAT